MLAKFDHSIDTLQNFIFRNKHNLLVEPTARAQNRDTDRPFITLHTTIITFSLFACSISNVSFNITWIALGIWKIVVGIAINYVSYDSAAKMQRKNWLEKENLVYLGCDWVIKFCAKCKSRPIDGWSCDESRSMFSSFSSKSLPFSSPL